MHLGYRFPLIFLQIDLFSKVNAFNQNKVIQIIIQSIRFGSSLYYWHPYYHILIIIQIDKICLKLALHLSVKISKMRINIGRPSTGGKEAAYQRFRAKNPNYVAEWRRKRREKSGAPIRTVGRPKKRRPNFMATVKAQNKSLIAKRVGGFELIADEDTDDLFQLRRSNIHGIGVFILDSLPSETFLMEYKGELISAVESDERERHYMYSDKS